MLTFKIEGLESLGEKIQQLKPAALKKLDDAVFLAANRVRTEAIKRVPVDTARLKKSIQIKRELSKPQTVEVGTPVNYAVHVEYGTAPHNVSSKALAGWVRRHRLPKGVAYAIANTIKKRGTAAQPFLTPALEATQEQVQTDIKNALIDAFTGGGK